MTLSTWQALGLGQLLILLVAAVAVLAWMLHRRGRTATAPQEAPRPPAATDHPDALAEVYRFLEGELGRTRAQRERNDRNLPDHVLATRINYLQAELDALAYAEAPDPFWAHLCECIDGWHTPQAGADENAGADDESLAATHSRLQRLLKAMEQQPPSQVVVRQLAVIERRLAAIQRQTGNEEEEEEHGATADVAAESDADGSAESEELR